MVNHYDVVVEDNLKLRVFAQVNYFHCPEVDYLPNKLSADAFSLVLYQYLINSLVVREAQYVFELRHMSQSI